MHIKHLKSIFLILTPPLLLIGILIMAKDRKAMLTHTTFKGAYPPCTKP